MVSIEDYFGREQSYVKHILLDRYLEALAYKTASAFPHIVYVDGFAGPWQSSNERNEDTSFGIALGALRRAKEAWKKHGRNVRMSAFLVERDATAYAKLAKIPARYPDISIKSYEDDFLTVLPTILKDTPKDAFAFFLIDPKGWRIPLKALGAMLARPKSEVIFNFMFDFINRAASIKAATIVQGLNELIPYGDWRAKLDQAAAHERKDILVDGFAESLEKLGNYEYVAETTVLRPVADRPLYCLVYATHSAAGVEVFRDCQVKALTEESKTRAETKVKATQENTGQGEFFDSFHVMGPDELTSFLLTERHEAEKTLLELTPKAPASILYEKLWPQVLTRHVVRHPDVNKIAARLRGEKKLIFPDWEKRRKVPQPKYRTQRASA
jgi:three-Cys-motif partner protein